MVWFSCFICWLSFIRFVDNNWICIFMFDSILFVFLLFWVRLVWILVWKLFILFLNFVNFLNKFKLVLFCFISFFFKFFLVFFKFCNLFFKFFIFFLELVILFFVICLIFVILYCKDNREFLSDIIFFISMWIFFFMDIFIKVFWFSNCCKIVVFVFCGVVFLGKFVFKELDVVIIVLCDKYKIRINLNMLYRKFCLLYFGF